MVWAWAAARKLDGYDSAQWREKLKAALSQAESNLAGSSSAGWWLYTAGVLQTALGNAEEGKGALYQALLAPENRMSHHLSRLALAGATPQAKPQ